MSQWQSTLSDGRTIILEADQQPTDEEVLSALDEYNKGRKAEIQKERAAIKGPTLGQVLGFGEEQEPSTTPKTLPRHSGRMLDTGEDITPAPPPTLDDGQPSLHEPSIYGRLRTSEVGRFLLGETSTARELQRTEGGGGTPGTGEVLGGVSMILPFGLEGKAGKALMTYFAGNYLWHTPGQFKQAKDAYNKGDYQTAKNIIVQNALSGAITAVGLHGTFAKEPPQFQGPIATGEALPQRPGAPAPRPETPAIEPATPEQKAAAALRNAADMNKDVAPLTAAAVEQQIVEGEANASRIRSDKEELPAPGQEPKEGEGTRSEDVHQAAPGPGEGTAPQETQTVEQPSNFPAGGITLPPVPEKITASAVEHEGKIETGANHPEILKRLGIKGFETRESRNTPQFGFVTDTGRFVSREEAGDIATASGQNLEEFEAGEQVHSDQIASPVEPSKALGDVPQPKPKRSTGKPAQIDYESPSGARAQVKVSTVKYEDLPQEMKDLVDREHRTTGEFGEAQFREWDKVKTGKRKVTLTEYSGEGKATSYSVTLDKPERVFQYWATRTDLHDVKLNPEGERIRAGAVAEKQAREERAQAEKQARIEADRIEREKRARYDEEVKKVKLPTGKKATVTVEAKDGNPLVLSGTQYGDFLIHKDQSSGKYKVTHVRSKLGVSGNGFHSLSAAKDYVRALMRSGVKTDFTTQQEAMANKANFHKYTQVAQAFLGAGTGKTPDFFEPAPEPAPAPAEVKEAGGQYVAPSGTTPEITGMGGAKAGEIQETGPRETGPATHGIAARVTEEQARRGVVAPVEPGEGISPADSVERGRELLAKGLHPQRVIENFNRTNALNADDMAVVGAEDERLLKATYDAYDQFGPNDPRTEAAWEASSNFRKAIKPMQTEWHRIGQAQQGETDIDTGSFIGLRRAYNDATGGDFTPDEKKAAEEVVQNVKQTQEDEKKARDKFNSEFKTKATSRTSTQAEKAALDAAMEVTKQIAVDTANAENERRVADAQRQGELDTIEARRKKAVESARTDRARKEAERKAEAERRAAVAKAKRATELAEIERKRIKRALDAATEQRRRAAEKLAKKERELQANPEMRVWNKAKELIDAGEDNFDEIRHKVATELGMKVNEVTRWLAYDRRIRKAADEVWRRQLIARRMKMQAKEWLNGLDTPTYRKVLASIPRTLFRMKVGFHGTVALATHAPMPGFDPRFWVSYANNFFRMYRMVGSNAYYEKQVQNLLRDPHWAMWRRAGLINDPYEYEDYMSLDIGGKIAKKLGIDKPVNSFTRMGNRGYSVLKMLRQDMANDRWEALPKSLQIPEVAQAIAKGVNHETGVVQGMAPKGSSLVAFAPRLMASRAMWLIGDPVKAAETFINWRNAGPGERYFAVNQVKSKLWVFGTYLALLQANQGLLTATDSKQKINMSDPFKGDFLKFKAFGLNIGYGNAMITMARLPVRLIKIRESSGGKLKNLIYPDEDTSTVLFEYGRSQASPFASLVADLWFKADWQNRPLPSSNRPVPKRLRAEGVKPYTWPEFWEEALLPIPFEEGMREVWKQGWGMSEANFRAYRKAFLTSMLMGATGARIQDDWDPNSKPPEGQGP